MNQPRLKEKSILIPTLRLLTKPTAAFSAIHGQNGDLVLTRFFQKKLLFISNPEHIEEVFALEARNLISRDFLYEARKPLFRDGLINSRNDLWKNQRRLLNPLFSKEAILNWKDLIIDSAEGLVDTLKNRATTEVNLSVEIKQVVQTVLIGILFGCSKGIDEDKRLIEAIDTITNGLIPQLASEVLFKGKLKQLFAFKNNKFEKSINDFTAFVYQEMEQRKNPSGQDLISHMIRAKLKSSEYNMTSEQLKDEAVNLFFAGQDTTNNSLLWFFYLIATNEAVHDKISAEIKRFKNDSLTPENLDKLSYTKAVLYESLRLYPSIIALARQTKEEVQIGGYSIEKEANLFLSIYATHRNKHLWERPNAFYPEHFLEQAGCARHKYAFMPFGGGMHNCIGKHLAEMEMLLIIVTVLRAFSFKSNTVLREAVSITLKPDRDLIVSLQPND
ncbi:MAG: cytochrome P450 [Methylicorpusculum sp.]|uniref:cytochrome P450 n=1 Tax=Methylicorpusculum sp. TaxID=2713644 RepID=UPI0027222B3D|nr:cytochrome P450 [Methylicorpusculum sp.]MDO8941075.1 cytochrome P450 [Methylicorpusculum sp.]MDP2202326.1 cytochrome P450 [Methylicorpusculum sp.]